MDKNTELSNVNLALKYWKKKTLNREKVLGVQQKQNNLPCVIINARETRATILTRNFCAVLKIMKMHLKEKPC